MSTTRGGQITLHNLRMWWQVNVTTIKYVNIFSGLIGLLSTYLLCSPSNLNQCVLLLAILGA